MAQPKTIGSREIHAAIERLAAAIAERHGRASRLLLLGIANGGIELARRLARQLSSGDRKLTALVGTLDISFHRDDIGRNPIPKEFAPTHIPADVNGGIELARRLARQLSSGDRQLTALVGTLDISFHRDDIGRNPIPKEFVPTHIPADVNGATVILVDDVLFSGRTVKAALDELFDQGRPAKVELAILVDRGGRRLPINADYCAMTLPATETERVVLRLDSADHAKDVLRIEPASPAARRSAS